MVSAIYTNYWRESRIWFFVKSWWRPKQSQKESIRITFIRWSETRHQWDDNVALYLVDIYTLVANMSAYSVIIYHGCVSMSLFQILLPPSGQTLMNAVLWRLVSWRLLRKGFYCGATDNKPIYIQASQWVKYYKLLLSTCLLEQGLEIASLQGVNSKRVDELKNHVYYEPESPEPKNIRQSGQILE